MLKNFFAEIEWFFKTEFSAMRGRLLFYNAYFSGVLST